MFIYGMQNVQVINYMLLVLTALLFSYLAKSLTTTNASPVTLIEGGGMGIRGEGGGGLLSWRKLFVMLIIYVSF